MEGLFTSFPETIRDVRIFTVPGRTELAGNHTDHNNGKVLAGSIQLDSVAAVSPRDDKKIIFRSTGFPDVVVDISETTPKKEEAGTTEALVRGIVAEFIKRGIKINGFTANADSTVLPGSGLSSSAAVEVLFGTIFNQLYGNGQFSPIQIAQFGQNAENNYFGKPSGLMDQAACASGGVIAIDFENPKNPRIEHIDFDPAFIGYALCIVDTRGSHADLTPDYAAIPGEMKAVARFFGQETLRKVELADILAHIPELGREAGDRALLRSFHYFDENKRVDRLTNTLKELKNEGDKKRIFKEYLRLVNEAGDSSWELLQNVFSPKNPSIQGIALGLALTKIYFKHKLDINEDGACRVHGGGFAGAIQVYLPEKNIPSYKLWMEQAFMNNAVTILRIRRTGAAELHF
jgi:galactokinase